jgi:glycosyltransferase involved in cell wall biosynthesis
LRIAIHVPTLSLPKCGIWTYTEKLIRGLSAVDRDSEYTIFAGEEACARLGELGANFEKVRRNGSTGSRWAGVLWEQTVLPRELARRGIDLLHSVNMVAPTLVPCRSVVTFHDLTMTLFPGLHSRLRRKFYALAVPVTMRRADAVICVSQSTKRDLLRTLPAKAERVFVVHNGVDGGAIANPVPDAQNTILQRFAIDGAFVLYVGTLEPRKNVVRLIEAFAMARSLSDDFPRKLVLAGRKGWQYKEIFAKVRERSVEDDVRFVGGVDDADLRLLYASATAVAYPSLYEGFGLPVLEAMAAGTPVLASDVSSIPEVAGDAAVLVNPYDTREIARGLLRICLDSGLREWLRKKGEERAKTFSWERTARETREVYERCLSSSGSPRA